MKHLMWWALIASVVTGTTVLSGCSHGRYFGNGKYESANYDNPEHMDDHFNEFDSHTLILSTLEDFEKCHMNKNMVFMVSNVENQTPEMLDVTMLTRELVDQLHNHGFTVVDKASRPELFQEYEYNDTGLVNRATAAVKGRQAGVNFLLRAAMVEKVQEVNDEKTVRYRLSIQAVDMESALVKCSGATEIKKRFERSRVTL